MALMEQARFEGFADRIATQFSFIKTCFDALGASANNNPDTNNYYHRITSSGEPDVELALLQPANSADEWFNGLSPTTITRGYTNLTGLITAFESSLVRDGSLVDKSLDGYLTDAGIKVSDYTNQVYFASKAKYLLAANVWKEEIVELSTTSGAAGTFAGINTLYDTPGEWTATQLADGTHFMGVPVKVEIKTLDSADLAAVGITIHGYDASGTLTSESITLNGGIGVISSATTTSFIDITNVTVDSGTFVDGDSFAVINTVPRTIAF